MPARATTAPRSAEEIETAPASRDQFKADVAELRDRLTAVVTATSDAANTIISGLEHVIAFGTEGDAQNRAFDALSACVFHDIVGQHVARAAELLAIIEKLGAVENAAEAASPPARASGLVNGPAVDGKGLRQSDVDDFFR